jgi:hypothetical protein
MNDRIGERHIAERFCPEKKPDPNGRIMMSPLERRVIDEAGTDNPDSYLTRQQERIAALEKQVAELLPLKKKVEDLDHEIDALRRMMHASNENRRSMFM